MPWPLSGRKQRRVSSGDLLNESAAFSLDLGESGTGATGPDRRSSSLDISRSSLSHPALSSLSSEEKRQRRSSFPRLALPSWRTSPNAITAATSEGLADGDVELQPGHATPYTATGLKGGFVVDRSTSSAKEGEHPRVSSGSSWEDEDDEGASLRTAGSSRTKVLVSPFLTPVDSGFAEGFGPDTVIEAEVNRTKRFQAKPTEPPLKADVTVPPEAANQGEDASGTLTHKKTRSRGWFSFSNATLPDAPSVSTRGDDLPSKDPSVQLPPSTPPAVKKNKASATPVTKGRSTMASALKASGRRRGNSEVSMKEMGADN